MGAGNDALVFQYRPQVLTSGDYYPSVLRCLAGLFQTHRLN